MLPRGNRRPGRPPAAKADETRQRIIQAARLVFSERGYDGATFQAIAARADLTRPAINHYFSSKRALYQEVMDETNEFVIGVGIKEADRETTLVGRLTAFISAAVKANAENPAGSAFIIGGVLESQRHPEWNTAENDSVRIAREFLIRVVNDAIEHGEVAADIDASALVETLLVVMCGVGLYAGYVETYQEMLAVTGMLRQLLEGALWRPGS
ncbi:TetR/AcrR family transcriptional regulator [Mycobacterium avium]|jgi:AcrR family transcriptional regulator|uniref:TetR/AcrR family transcriptional regulator n=2 Tax=Mycobacterium avium TaxID=1764 RepID=A0A2A3L7Y8_MYCAV|nr:TetR/AcrR family transcriptional regulator [Mycobacterium avium]ETA95787.1 TetR family transcriptional regulator [Mycobacterium avium 05-4293]ETB24254.1 TetR family transcriptional regulator [Mycobacterium avium subsp. avium 11-4751]ETB29702.1 TetR family transcriptional regulator [Mycobacterium avium 09-5983]ETB51911.1 TetR family transcriptional regulator [Mycobacterium avium 11-0986]ETB55864.1 TetR family transcriptional regulator [Mycobacterium avium 10-5560]EUA39258.1 bacterial regula